MTTNIAHCSESYDSDEQATEEVVGDVGPQLRVVQHEVGTTVEEETAEGADEDTVNQQHVGQVDHGPEDVISTVEDVEHLGKDVQGTTHVDGEEDNSTLAAENEMRSAGCDEVCHVTR